MEWNGTKNNSKPLAFVGKGVCFDTGGYSLKPAKFMEDMTYDMAGSGRGRFNEKFSFKKG